MLNNVKFIQKALIENDGKFLFIKRSEGDKNYPGKWDLPGGNIDRGENTIEALSREILEEVNLVCTDIKPIVTTSFNQGEIFVLAVIYKSKSVSGELKLSDEHSDHKWIDRQQIKDLDLLGWIKGLL